MIDKKHGYRPYASCSTPNMRMGIIFKKDSVKLKKKKKCVYHANPPIFISLITLEHRLLICHQLCFTLTIKTFAHFKSNNNKLEKQNGEGVCVFWWKCFKRLHICEDIKLAHLWIIVQISTKRNFNGDSFLHILASNLVYFSMNIKQRHLKQNRILIRYTGHQLMSKKCRCALGGSAGTICL